MSIDGTDFRIQEPAPFNRTWYSHKFRGPGFRYEVAISLDGNLVWWNGPWRCGSNPDLAIFRRSLRQSLLLDERVIADKGYRGEPRVWLPSEGSAIQIEAHRLIRARHESFNKRLKQWGCLKQVWRHQLSDHHLVFNAVALLTKLSIDSGEKLFHIDSNTLRVFHK